MPKKMQRFEVTLSTTVEASVVLMGKRPPLTYKEQDALEKEIVRMSRSYINSLSYPKKDAFVAVYEKHMESRYGFSGVLIRFSLQTKSAQASGARRVESFPREHKHPKKSPAIAPESPEKRFDPRLAERVRQTIKTQAQRPKTRLEDL